MLFSKPVVFGHSRGAEVTVDRARTCCEQDRLEDDPARPLLLGRAEGSTGGHPAQSCRHRDGL
jgi:hypothetical protein